MEEKQKVGIQKVREELRLSQQELADMLGVKQNTISGYERGIRTINAKKLKIYTEKINAANLFGKKYTPLDLI